MLLIQFARRPKSIATLWQSVCDAITWIRQQASKGFDPPKESGRERGGERESRLRGLGEAGVAASMVLWQLNLCIQVGGIESA